MLRAFIRKKIVEEEMEDQEEDRVPAKVAASKDKDGKADQLTVMLLDKLDEAIDSYKNARGAASRIRTLRMAHARK